VRQALASPELSALYAERGFTPKFAPPETVRTYMTEETKSWGDVIRQANIQFE
jgi:tripartite-type tricarboxylate transporter receptor subunit TctC